MRATRFGTIAVGLALACVAHAVAPAPGAAGFAQGPATTHDSVRTDPGPNSDGPNIVVLLLDDFPAMDSRVLERLPNIKKTFLDQGISFTNYWANFPLCCPGRATLLTGQRATHTGVRTNSAAHFDPSVTLATELDAAGYRTMIFGKYLNGTRKLADKTPPGWDELAIKDSPPYYKYPIWINGKREYHGTGEADYSTDVVANESMRLISSAPASEPLFILMTPNATHGGYDEAGHKVGKQPVPAPRHRGDERCAGIPPWNPPNYNEADVSDKPAYVRQLPLLRAAGGWPLERACESLLSVDEWLGRVVAELKSQDRYDDTIFVLTQDNGMGWGSHRIVAKNAPYTAEMNLYVSWPAVIGQTATENSTLLSNVDIAPTLCEISGCAMGPFANGLPVDGQSFAGLLDPGAYSSIPQRDSIVIENGDGSTVPTYRALLTGENHPRGQWLFVRYVGTREKELYDVSGSECWDWSVGDPGDPCMLTNVVSRMASLRMSLAAELAAEW